MLATAYVLNAADSGGGSLRQAIIDANNHPGPDRIDFSLMAGTGARTIDLLSPLPPILESVVIDGASASGYAGSPLIELRGDLAGVAADGLVIAAGPTTARGLAVNGFAGAGIVARQGAGIALVGNVIGTDPTGTLARPNGGPGVDIQADAPYAVVGMARDWRGLQDPPTTPTFATNANPHAISAADLDGDGRPDLVTANFGGTVTVLLSSGGGFAPAVNYSTAGALTDGVTLADLNGDGKIDIATANRDSNNVSVLLNTGAGIFAAPTRYAAGTAPHSVNAADLDGDGDADLAVVNRDSRDVTILANNGTGGFAPPVAHEVGGFPFESTVADFNGDGKPDLAVDNATSNTVSVLINMGGAAFAPRVDYPVGSGPHSITSGDFDGDGSPDIATTDNFSGTVSLLHNNGDGTFAAAGNVPIPGVIDIATADINGDGRPDLVTANTNNSVAVLLNDGAGGFAVTSTWDATGSPRAVAAADFDGDGDLDVAVAQFGEANARVYANLGSSPGGNLIAANHGDGVRLNGSHGVVAANTVGQTGLGNGGNGILIGSDARSNQIGLAGSGNLILGNSGAGVAVTGALSLGHGARFNRFAGNALGIDLGADGSTPNDPGDVDTGPNQFQNTPQLTSALPGSTTRVVGTIDTAPSTTVVVDVYTSSVAAPGPGQGQRWLGSIRVTTNAVGHASFDVVLAAPTATGEALTATATAPDGSTSEFAASIAVASSNHAPTATLTGPGIAVPGQPRVYTLGATDPDSADTVAGFTYAVDFGDGTPVQTIAASANNGAGVPLTHVFTTTGSFTITLRATDARGASSASVALGVLVESAQIQPDPMHPGQTLLAVGGTLGDDTIKIKPGQGCGEVKVVIRDNEHEIFHRHAFDPVINRIAVYGQSGDDDLVINPAIDIPAWLHGGDGDDRLKGGGGPSVLLGGSGDDLLVGQGGRDLLIGGRGSDRIVGSASDDILIAGSTAHDANDAALAMILAEWNSSRAYADRVRNLRGDASCPTFAARANGNVFLAVDATHGRAVTVFDDGVADVLTGDGGLDWFLFNADGDNQAKKDKATDLRAAEFADDLDFITGP